MNNLAFMRNLARFDSGITNLSPEMLNLASPQEGVEKVCSTENRLKTGDQKCMRGRRKSFIGHPCAVVFSTVS
jgi:hypothetical protein